MRWPDQVAQLVTSLATDACLTKDPGVTSLIPALSHSFVDIDHETISAVILLPSAEWIIQEGLLIVYEWKYVHEVLVYRAFKLAQEKVWFGELTAPGSPVMTIAVNWLWH